MVCFTSEAIIHLSESPLVLASKQPETVDTKGKDYATAKWEAELRKTLKNKKPAASSLSKQDQALIQEQLRKESAIRQRVALTKKRLEHGLELIRSLASAQVDEFRLYLSNLAALLLTGGFGQASQLIGFKSFDVFIVCYFALLVFVNLVSGFRRGLRNVVQKD